MRPFAKAIVQVAYDYGLSPRITSTRRSYAAQSRLYNNFLAGHAIYPAAPPGTSAHEYGYAMDMIVTPYAAIRDLGRVWVQWGGEWHASDEIHFQYPGFSPPGGLVKGRFGRAIVNAADVILGFVPGIGEVELGAELLKLGFPQSEILDFLSSPLAHTLTK